MPRYKGKDIFDFIGKIGRITDDLEKVLSTDISGAEQLKELSVLLKERKEALLFIKEWFDGEEGNKFIQKNAAEWDKRIAPILEKDKKNVKVIENRVDNLGKELRNLIKNKSLLIYSERRK